MKRLRTLILAVSLATTVTSSGCAGLTFPTAITDIRSAVDVADMVITAIQTFGQSYFATHPNQDAQAKFNTLVAQAEASAAAALAAANGASDLKADNVTAAFADFETVYSNLLALGQSLGIKISASATKPGAEVMGDVLVVPPPAALLPAGVKVAPASGLVSLRSPGDSTVATPPDDRPLATLSKCDAVDELGACFVSNSQTAEQGGSAFGVMATPQDLREWGGAAPASRAAGTALGVSASSPGSASPAKTALSSEIPITYSASAPPMDGWVRVRGGSLFHCPHGTDGYDCMLISVAQ